MKVNIPEKFEKTPFIAKMAKKDSWRRGGDPLEINLRDLGDVELVELTTSPEYGIIDIWSERFAPPRRQEMKIKAKTNMSGWIKCSERMPKAKRDPDALGDEVLIWPCRDGETTAFYGRRATGNRATFYRYGVEVTGVTHWKPLPASLQETHDESGSRDNPARPIIVRSEHLKYLDRLRVSGKTNMLGAGSYLERNFDLTQAEAREILGYWMRTFTTRQIGL